MAIEVSDDDAPRRRRVRRAALLWGLIAAGFYFGFIVLAVVRAFR
jgi:hypothetical protein